MCVASLVSIGRELSSIEGDRMGRDRDCVYDYAEQLCEASSRCQYT